MNHDTPEAIAITDKAARELLTQEMYKQMIAELLGLIGALVERCVSDPKVDIAAGMISAAQAELVEIKARAQGAIAKAEGEPS